jgi:hypothetical protein
MARKNFAALLIENKKARPNGLALKLAWAA